MVSSGMGGEAVRMLSRAVESSTTSRSTSYPSSGSNILLSFSPFLARALSLALSRSLSFSRSLFSINVYLALSAYV